MLKQALQLFVQEWINEDEELKSKREAHKGVKQSPFSLGGLQHERATCDFPLSHVWLRGGGREKSCLHVNPFPIRVFPHHSSLLQVKLKSFLKKNCSQGENSSWICFLVFKKGLFFKKLIK